MYDLESQRVGEHPRVRGENSLVRRSVVRIRGTSPRARGKRFGEHVILAFLGNIPACAGKTLA